MERLLEYEEWKELNEGSTSELFSYLAFFLILFGISGIAIYFGIKADKKRAALIKSIIDRHLNYQEMGEIKSILKSDDEYRRLINQYNTNKRLQDEVDSIMGASTSREEESASKGILRTAASTGLDIYANSKNSKIETAIAKREKEILPANLYKKLNTCRYELEENGVGGAIGF